MISRGPGLSFIESTAVSEEGRASPQDLGLWADSQIPGLRELTTFAHSQNQKIGIQLAHGGRKASTVALWLSFGETAAKEVGGWPDNVWAPSRIQHFDGYPQPRELTREGIKRIVKDFADAARRSVDAGFDAIELHGAHGLLLHEFMSPITNLRTDDYGGSFEGRTRIVVEIVDAVREVVPKDMPLFFRFGVALVSMARPIV